MIDQEQIRHWVGREQTVVDDLRAFPARGLAAALNRASAPKDGDVLPLGWQWMYFLDTPSAFNTGSDGHQKQGEFLPPAPLPRRMWAAGRAQIEQPLRVGVPASRHSSIRSIETKSGKSGDLVFVTVDHRYEQQGQHCLQEEQNLVYRQMPEGPAPLPPGQRPEHEADVCRIVQPDPVTLFRYSALTYNSHRIHYDRNYATQSEHYPALVVHGPLLATMLLELGREQLPAALITEFRFRAIRPTFDSHHFSLNLARDGDQLELWTADHEGFVCVSAFASIKS